MANVYMGTDVEDFIFGEATYEEACSKEAGCGKKEACSKEAGCGKKEACSKEAGCGKKEACKTENTDVSDISVDVETDKDGKIATQIKEEAEYDEEIMEAVEAEMDACGVMECVDDPEVACYRIALENEQNYNMVMNAFMQKEIEVMEATGSEMVYEAANIKTFFAAIQGIIDKFWTKIQGVVKAVNNKIISATAANSSFIKKYKGANLVTPTGDVKFKGYDFPMGYPNFDGVAKLVEKVKSDYFGVALVAYTVEESNETISKFRDDFTSIKNKMRGCMCRKDGEVTSDEFGNELNLAYFGASDKKKKELKLVSFGTIISELERGKGSKDALMASYKAAKATVAKLKATAKSSEAACSKGKNKDTVGMAAAKCLSDSISAATTIMSQGLSAKIAAINANMMQNRSMAAFYISHQPKAEKKAKNESATFEQELGITLI